MNGTHILLTAVAGYTLAAALTDLVRHRIPNALTVPAAVAGVAFHALAPEGWGLLTSLAGLALGFSLLLVPFLLGGGGAGDVKLLAALGAWLGPKLILVAFGLSVFTAACLALTVLSIHAVRRGVSHTQRRYLGSARRVPSPPRRVLPFALPVAIGAWSVLAWLIQQ